jgi:hypothetical protein
MFYTSKLSLPEKRNEAYGITALCSHVPFRQVGTRARIVMWETTSALLSLPCPTIQITKKPPWSESASKLHWLSDRRMSAKWLPTFTDRGCHLDSVTDPHGRILDRSRYFSSK